ncbi:MAG: acetylornithine deacetylase [Rickettsiales bacterium]|nr:acetylornithine deacetylase [Rickettsiales bacterium]
MHNLTDAAISILADLVGFNSVSALSNLPVIEYIETYLERHGVPCTRVPSPDGKKSNLLARIGPAAPGGIVLSGHTDVVPVEGQPWVTDPFTLTRKGEMLFGRGTSDMKSFIAVCLALVEQLKDAATKKPFWLAFSYDEEVGCLGVPYLLEYMVSNTPMPAYAIIGEPTMMQVVTAHKGVVSFETTVTGLEWHSSQPHLGVNAVHVACELVNLLAQMAREQTNGPTRDERFNPPHSTVHVGLMHGGTARNIIPRECVFQWEIRPLPGFAYKPLIERFHARAAELEVEMKKVHPGAGIHTRPISHMSGVTLPATAQSACAHVMHAARTNAELAVSFGTEAGVFNERGIPAIICGPGDIQQAHKPNEFIEVAQIGACVDFLLRLTADMVQN